jgi:hypothetical protein
MSDRLMVILLSFSRREGSFTDVSRFFTGAPTDKSLWLLIGGFVAGIAGFSGLAQK